MAGDSNVEKTGELQVLILIFLLIAVEIKKIRFKYKIAVFDRKLTENVFG